MKHRSFFGKSISRIILALLIALPINVLAAGGWSYQQDRDRLTNQSYSYARSPLPSSAQYELIRLEVACKENKLQFVVDSNSLIASQGRSFDVEYQVDKKPPVTISMKTFADSKRRGYTEEHAREIIDDILSGQSIFIRVNTMIKQVLTAAITLEGAGQPIQQVFADCGIGVSDKTESGAAYGWAEFEQDFQKLSSAQQQEVLGKIKKIMQEMR
ncbi:hypothetical protein [Methylobacter sp. YRD-M1]|uniref:hypothetical protein n=1 Tax=Methylobacter sp. YRD-M1 TaxID=2911520 RepID=UPI00227C8C15|nr:hypothetical protein [Methylobacter sp. YRD-M1]WAK03491.1 hypothetical protein LZ558_06850 [Methylobacter sp. YRD-M1]